MNPRPDSEYELRLLHAFEALNKDETLSLRTASRQFGVSRTTLTNRHQKKAKPRIQAHLEQQLLTEEEEKELQQWAERLDDIGAPPRLPHLHQMAANLVQQRNGGQRIHLGDHWMTRFLTHHPKIAVRFASRINQERDAGTQPASIKTFFAQLGEVRSRHHILPGDTWNADEKGFAIGVAKKAKVICRRNRKNPRIRQPGNWEWVTLMEAISATGDNIPGFFIYLGEAHLMGNHDYDERENASFALSSTGWTNDRLGVLWLVEHFEPATRTGRPPLLIIDGHSSHLTVEFLEHAFTHNIHLLCFPSHSTHLLQPLDVGIFGPLAQYYSNEVDLWARAHPYQFVSKGDFFPLCQKARHATLTDKNIRAAFMATGIYPFRRAQVMNLIEKTKKNPPIGQPNQQPPLPGTTDTHLLDSPLVPTNTREVVNLWRQIEISRDISQVKAGGAALAIAAESAIASSAIATETIRQIASAPKKSKSDRRHISKAILLSRSHLDKARKLRLEKDSQAKARKEAREQWQLAQKDKQSLAVRAGSGSGTAKKNSSWQKKISVTSSTQPTSCPELGATPLLQLQTISGN